jgi:hypothetical protein
VGSAVELSEDDLYVFKEALAVGFVELREFYPSGFATSHNVNFWIFLKYIVKEDLALLIYSEVE